MNLSALQLIGEDLIDDAMPLHKRHSSKSLGNNSHRVLSSLTIRGCDADFGAAWDSRCNAIAPSLDVIAHDDKEELLQQMFNLSERRKTKTAANNNCLERFEREKKMVHPRLRPDLCFVSNVKY